MRETGFSWPLMPVRVRYTLTSAWGSQLFEKPMGAASLWRLPQGSARSRATTRLELRRPKRVTRLGHGPRPLEPTLKDLRPPRLQGGRKNLCSRYLWITAITQGELSSFGYAGFVITPRLIPGS